MEPNFECKHGGLCQFLMMHYNHSPNTVYWHCPKCGLHLRQIMVRMPVAENPKPVMQIAFVVEKEGEANGAK